ncbi:hypothetical protein T492DRAFT_545526 [Pavlovales sp. CCMP2436]|nr:hypothetical protein T492DRAFT_545526 [Pavlovales sp. CCMP2436]
MAAGVRTGGRRAAAGCFLWARASDGGWQAAACTRGGGRLRSGRGGKYIHTYLGAEGGVGRFLGCLPMPALGGGRSLLCVPLLLDRAFVKGAEVDEEEGEEQEQGGDRRTGDRDESEEEDAAQAEADATTDSSDPLHAAALTKRSQVRATRRSVRQNRREAEEVAKNKGAKDISTVLADKTAHDNKDKSERGGAGGAGRGQVLAGVVQWVHRRGEGGFSMADERVAAIFAKLAANALAVLCTRQEVPLCSFSFLFIFSLVIHY